MEEMKADQKAAVRRTDEKRQRLGKQDREV